MYYQARDRSIEHITTRKQHRCYGMGLGIIILDDVYPGFPGDVRNASAYPFPIQYEVVKGVDIDTLLYAEDKSRLAIPILEAAKKLEDMGCRAIAAECGYFAWFQQEIAGKVEIPVFMSSLLQVPLIQQTIGPDREVGILCAEIKAMTEEHLKRVGIQPRSNYFINGAQDEYSCPDFDSLWDPNIPWENRCANYNSTERDMVKIALDMKEKHPKMASLMLECTGMQPFARAVQRAIDMPVYSWGTLLDYAYSVVNHREYYGHV